MVGPERKRQQVGFEGSEFGSYYTEATEFPLVTGGTYTLCIELTASSTIDIGALGAHELPAGAYAYTGSAFGTGGFSRVDRHYELAAGKRETRHWHIDYLLGHGNAVISGDIRTSGADIECAVAAELPASPVPEFGSSDCNCLAHLAYDEDGARLREAAASAHRRLTGNG